MKRLGVVSTLFLALPFCYSCNEQYNVYIEGEHFRYTLSSPKAIKGKTFMVTFEPEKYYEVYKNSISEVKVGDAIYQEGVWTYDETTHVLSIDKSMILGDVYIKIDATLGQYIIKLYPGSWETDPKGNPADIDIDHEHSKNIFHVTKNIESFDKSCVSINPSVDFEIELNGDKKTLTMNPNDFYRNYTITLKNE